MAEWKNSRSPDLCAGREHCLREWLTRLFGRQASRAASLSMIKNENTEDPVREKPTTGHELNSRDQDHGPADLGKAELWAGRLLYEYWDNKFPVDPNSIAVKMGMDVYFVPIPGELAGVILKDDRKKTPSIFVDKYADTPRKRLTIAHEIGHYVERFRDSDSSPSQQIPGYFGFSDESIVSDEEILGGVRSANSRELDQSPQELFADHFARSLLMPENEIQRFVGLGMNIDDVAIYFGVSAVTMRNRLNGLRIDL